MAMEDATTDDLADDIGPGLGIIASTPGRLVRAASWRPGEAPAAQPMSRTRHSLMALPPFPDDHDALPAAGDADGGPDADRPSKTRRKKAMLALQSLGERLVALPESRLKAVPLDDDLRDAIDMARGIRSHEGRRRQLQYVGRLMRSADAAAIEAALAGDDAAHARQVAAHHAAEQWRDGLIAGSRQPAEFIARFPLSGSADTTADAAAGTTADPAAALASLASLASLVEAARGAARSASSNPRPARALYRALLHWLTTSEDPDR